MKLALATQALLGLCSATCTLSQFTAPKNVPCNITGTVADPNSFERQFPGAMADACYVECLQDPFCSFIAFDPSTNLCTSYSTGPVKAGFKKSKKSAILFASRYCYYRSDGPCGSPANGGFEGNQKGSPAVPDLTAAAFRPWVFETNDFGNSTYAEVVSRASTTPSPPYGHHYLVTHLDSNFTLFGYQDFPLFLGRNYTLTYSYSLLSASYSGSNVPVYLIAAGYGNPFVLIDQNTFFANATSGWHTRQATFLAPEQENQYHPRSDQFSFAFGTAGSTGDNALTAQIAVDEISIKLTPGG